uniref:CLK4-associating serine/arginine rich protein-like n=1 Tax=Phascolarctos cinereus TaxID=38626 RepID=A0A6P5LZS8_PHACI|nr:CLK4-associating serine/arginine rich protein-like [Phascolarctos cinereus]
MAGGQPAGALLGSAPRAPGRAGPVRLGSLRTHAGGHAGRQARTRAAAAAAPAAAQAAAPGSSPQFKRPATIEMGQWKPRASARHRAHAGRAPHSLGGGSRGSPRRPRGDAQPGTRGTKRPPGPGGTEVGGGRLEGPGDRAGELSPRTEGRVRCRMKSRLQAHSRGAARGQHSQAGAESEHHRADWAQPAPLLPSSARDSRDVWGQLHPGHVTSAPSRPARTRSSRRPSPADRRSRMPFSNLRRANRTKTAASSRYSAFKACSQCAHKRTETPSWETTICLTRLTFLLIPCKLKYNHVH